MKLRTLGGKKRPKRLGKRGMTLVEVMLTLTIFLIIMPAVVSLFSAVTKAFAHDEAMNSLKKTNQELISYLYLKLGTSKRLFEASPVTVAGSPVYEGVTLLDSLDMGTDVASGLTPPLMMAGLDRKLPAIKADGSYDHASANYPVTHFGNILLFLSQGDKIMCRGVTNYGGVPVTQVIDTYKVHCFYLTPENPRAPAGFQTYRLIEWRSAPLADGKSLKDVNSNDPTLATNLIDRLKNPTPEPTVQVPVTYAVDYTQPVSTMFATLEDMAASVTNTGVAYLATLPRDYPVTLITQGVTFLQRNEDIQFRSWTYMHQMGMGRTFRYGIAPNNADWQVPAFAQVSGEFSGGFEVGIIGPPAARQILVRITHVASGLGGQVIGRNIQTIFCRDVW